MSESDWSKIDKSVLYKYYSTEPATFLQDVCTDYDQIYKARIETILENNSVQLELQEKYNYKDKPIDLKQFTQLLRDTQRWNTQKTIERTAALVMAYHKNQKVTMKSTATQSESVSDLVDNLTSSIDSLNRQLDETRTMLIVQRRKNQVLVAEHKEKDEKLEAQQEELKKRIHNMMTFAGKEQLAQAYQQDLKQKITDTKAQIADLEVTVKSQQEEIQAQSKRLKFFQQVTQKLRKENEVLGDELVQAVGTHVMKQLRTNLKLKMADDGFSDFDRSRLVTEGQTGRSQLDAVSQFTNEKSGRSPDARPRVQSRCDDAETQKAALAQQPVVQKKLANQQNPPAKPANASPSKVKLKPTVAFAEEPKQQPKSLQTSKQTTTDAKPKVSTSPRAPPLPEFTRKSESTQEDPKPKVVTFSEPIYKQPTITVTNRKSIKTKSPRNDTPQPAFADTQTQQTPEKQTKVNQSQLSLPTDESKTSLDTAEKPQQIYRSETAVQQLLKPKKVSVKASAATSTHACQTENEPIVQLMIQLLKTQLAEEKTPVKVKKHLDELVQKILAKARLWQSVNLVQVPSVHLTQSPNAKPHHDSLEKSPKPSRHFSLRRIQQDSDEKSSESSYRAQTSKFLNQLQ